MTKITYIGPPSQTCPELAEIVELTGELEPGASFDVPAEFADRLLASNANFEGPKTRTAAAKKKAARKPRAKKSPPPAKPVEAQPEIEEEPGV